MKELEERIQWYREEYLETPAGQKHLVVIEAEREEVQQVFQGIREKHAAGDDITDDVLRRLLLSQAQQQEIASPDRRQIDEILELLSNPVLDILEKENGGYVLALPPSAARNRLQALAGLLAGEE